MNEMMQSSLGRAMLYGFPMLSMVFISFQPAALQLYFAASGLLALIQGQLINTPSTRAMLGMVPIPPPPSPQELHESRLRLRMIKDQTDKALAEIRQKVNTEMQAGPAKEGNSNMIQKMMATARKEASNWKTEMGEKIDEMKGKPTGDGSHTVKPRLTDEQKKDAQAYKVMRDEEDRQQYLSRAQAARSQTIKKRRSSVSKRESEED